MSSRIWKFKLSVERETVVDMPEGSRVLSVGAQSFVGGIYAVLWALVPKPDAPKEARSFYVFVTGEEIREDITGCPFIGTLEMKGFIWHVFDKRPTAFDVELGKWAEHHNA